ncbi:extracellular solute-binding protein [Kitasatospora paracochleata]|uniref:Multiple sugar transport system substrate-binding protein n=1 Tax=Kitasatospora paracochleata TaxID=58354 RepID=A0ABT1J9Q7_9ACTN|nr:extracellular solute-binding protein [Kitasatospora paracochleata]MCP2314195.1 multiple sugar transport system substrate-binding protein [Kitasatospora paracochleata]
MRRSLVLAAGVSALMLVVAACSSSTGGATQSDPAGKVELTYWSWVPNMDKTVAKWNATHPDIQVKVNAVPGGKGGTYAKLFAALKAGNAPDLAQVEFDYLPNFIQQGGAEDITAYVGSAKSKFVGWTWPQVAPDGKHVYAVPQDTGPMALLYRKDLFDKAGIARPPATWQEFSQDAAVLAADHVAITTFPTNQSDWFAGLAWQKGARWFDIKGDKWQVSLTDPASEQVAEYWQKLIDAKQAKADQFFGDQWTNDLTTGKVASWITGAWGPATLSKLTPQQAGMWAVAPLPQWTANDHLTGNWGGSTVAVMKGAKNPKAAAEFALWLNSAPEAVESLVADGGLYPAVADPGSIKALSAPQQFWGQQSPMTPFGAQTLNTDWRWGPTMSETFTALNDATGTVGVSGTVVNALAAAQAKTVDAMKKQGFPVAQ